MGRGCLFGAVVAAAVVLDPEKPIRGLNDSKVLEAADRERLAEQIKARSLAWAYGAADAFEIDQINIYQASRLAMRRAVEALPFQPDYLLVDALKLDLAIEQLPLIGGDARCRAIAAASILAKVHRDASLAMWHQVFPQYNLLSNKGYSTPDHRRALLAHGPTWLHRFSFGPVRAASPQNHWNGYLNQEFEKPGNGSAKPLGQAPKFPPRESVCLGRDGGAEIGSASRVSLLSGDREGAAAP